MMIMEDSYRLILFSNYFTKTYHIVWNSESLEVFNILVSFVDDLCQFSSIHHLLEHPHLHGMIETGVLLDIAPHYSGNC